MDKRILVDSTIYIHLLRRREDPALALLDELKTLDLVTCGMVMLEVLRGIPNPHVKKRLDAFMAVMIFVPSNDRLWADATELAWRLDRNGRVLPGSDLLIAACALSAGAEILTLDKHFEAVPDLVLTPVPDGWR
jgi:predicted nucleic acid-binding protein